MQFKSILAVLALAVAVIATPIEPAAVNLNPAILVKRTTPQDVCNAAGKNLVATTCTDSSGPVSPSGVLDLLLDLSILRNILNIVKLKCVGRSLKYTLTFCALLTRPQLRLSPLYPTPARLSYAVLIRVTRT